MQSEEKSFDNRADMTIMRIWKHQRFKVFKSTTHAPEFCFCKEQTAYLWCAAYLRGIYSRKENIFMETSSTTQNNLTDEQGQASAQAKESKDKISESKRIAIDTARESIRHYNAHFRKEVLESLLKEVKKTTDPTEKIASLEQEIRRACDSLLDAKAKTVVAVLSELSSMSGVVNTGQFAVDILHGGYGKEDLAQALAENPDDSNIAFLSHVFDMASGVNEAEYDRHTKSKSAEPEETIEEPQTETDDEPQVETKGPGATVEDMVEDWLRKQDYSTKLAICIFSDYMCGDHGANNITHRIENEYRAEIINRAKNPNDSLSNEEILMTGICCELAVWSKNL